MKITRIVLIASTVIYLAVLGECGMEPYIVGGGYAKIADFPYSAYLGIKCMVHDGHPYSAICGSSIVNQELSLTAAHCLHRCTKLSTITIGVGHEIRLKGAVSTARGFIIHENYNSLYLANDIALVGLETPLTFGPTISRVALMKNPPYKEEAVVAGWGLADEESNTSSLVLKYTTQNVWDVQDCLALFASMPPGTFCARNLNDNGFASKGDSGSALVARGYIQLGLVSFKISSKSKSVVVYTDIGYFYDWIQDSVNKMLCDD